METTRTMIEPLLAIVSSAKNNLFSDIEYTNCNTPEDKKTIGKYAELIMDMILAQKRQLKGKYERNGTIPLRELLLATNSCQDHNYTNDILEFLQVDFALNPKLVDIEKKDEIHLTKDYDLLLQTIQIKQSLISVVFWDKMYEILDNLAIEKLKNFGDLKVIGCIFSDDIKFLKIPNYINRVAFFQQSIPLMEENQEEEKYDYYDIVKLGFVDCSEELTMELKGYIDGEFAQELVVKKMCHPELRKYNPHELPSEFLLMRSELPEEVSKKIPLLGRETSDSYDYLGIEPYTNKAIEYLKMYENSFTFDKPKDTNGDHWVIEISDKLRFSDYYIRQTLK